MKYSYALFGMILLGLFGFAVILAFQFITIGNEADYYSLKEAVEASMYESVDKVYYYESGEIKISQEKFVSNFTKRFVKNTIGNSTGYTISFYDIMEKPPKATVVIRDDTSSMSLSDGDFSIVNNLTGILEANKATYEVDDNDLFCSGRTYEINSGYNYYYSYFKLNGTNVSDNYYILSKPNSLIQGSSVVNVSSGMNFYVSEIEFVSFVSAIDTTSVGSYSEVLGEERGSTLCDTNYLSFNASSINKITGKSKGLSSSGEHYLKVSAVNDKSKSGSCYAIAKYKVYWKYGYCSS